MSQPSPDEPITAWAFHLEPGTEGWHVLYGGAQTVFPTASFAVGAALVSRIAAVTADLGREPDIDLRARTVAVVTARNPRGRVDRVDAEVARRVTAAAAELGLRPDPTLLTTIQFAIAESPGVETAPFWRAVLGYEWVEDVLADPQRRWPRIWFDEIATPGRGRGHVDVALPADAGETRLAAVLAAGGRIGRDDGVPDWWGVVSPDGHLIDLAPWGDVAGRPREESVDA